MVVSNKQEEEESNTFEHSKSFDEFVSVFTLPDFSQILNADIYIVAFTIAIVASLETLLSLDAVDKLDPYKRIAPANRELKAQGIGNFVSGLLGGLPVTAVIVRSTANISSGAKTKVSAVFHGMLLVASVALFPYVLNLIPLSALAAVLLIVGYKLAKPQLFKDIYKQGKSQFIPFVVTIAAILFTDLLIGITIGIITGLYFVITTNMHMAITIERPDETTYKINLEKDVSFLNKALLRRTLRDIPNDSKVIIDESSSIFIDHDIIETIEDFKITAEQENVELIIRQPKNTKNKVLSSMA